MPLKRGAKNSLKRSTQNLIKGLKRHTGGHLTTPGSQKKGSLARKVLAKQYRSAKRDGNTFANALKYNWSR